MDESGQLVLHECARQVPLLVHVRIPALGSSYVADRLRCSSCPLPTHSPGLSLQPSQLKVSLSRRANPFAQQDCAELLAHVAECLRSTLLDGGWDARVVEDGVVRVVDSGLNSCTISLDPQVAARADLQALNCWELARSAYHTCSALSVSGADSSHCALPTGGLWGSC